MWRAKKPQSGKPGRSYKTLYGRVGIGSALRLAPDHGRGWDIICSEGTGWSVPAGGRGRLWMDRVEDEVLGARVASGDERALWSRPLRRADLRDRDALPGRQGDAEELVQDVFTSVWKNAAGFDPARASFATWVYRITRNRATDLIRRRKRASGPSRANRSSNRERRILWAISRATSTWRPRARG